MLKLHTIRKKLILYFLLISIVPLLILGGYNVVITSSNLENTAINNLQDKSDEKVALLQASLRKVENDLRFLSTSFAINNLMEAFVFDDPDEINYWSDATANMYLSFSQNNDRYKKIRYINENGDEIVRIDCDGRKSWIVSKAERKNRSRQPFFSEVTKVQPGTIYSSRLALETEDGLVTKPFVPLMQYATPVFDEDGTGHGIVVLDVYAASFLNPFQMMNSGNALLVNHEGFFLAHPDSALAWGFQLDKPANTIKSEVDSITFKMMVAAQTGIADAGNGKILSYSPVYYQPSDSTRYWIAVIEESEEVIYAAVHSFIKSLLVIILAIGFIVFLISSLISKSFSRPISETVEVITKIANGNLHQPKLLTNSKDEIGELAKACNKMLDGFGQVVEKANDIAAGKLGAIALEEAIENGESVEAAAIRLANAEMYGLHGDLAEAFLKMLQQLKILTVQARFIAADALAHPALQHQQRGELGEAFNEMVQNLKILAQRANNIADGKLKTRTATNHSGEVAEGVLGSAFKKMQTQLTELVYRAEEIAAGKLGAEQAEARMNAGEPIEKAVLVHSNQKGDLEEAFDAMQSRLRLLTVQARLIAKDELHNPALKVVQEGELGSAFKGMLTNLLHSAKKMDAVAVGDLENSILKSSSGKNESKGVLGSSVNKTVTVLHNIVHEIDVLIKAARSGNLSMRAREENYEGTYKQLCQGINAMLEAFDNPITTISRILNSVAENDLTVHVDGKFDGSFETLQEGVNKTIHNLRTSITNIAGNARNLATSSEEFTAISEMMATNAVQTAHQSSTVSSASERISQSVNMVANGTSEMNHAIKEISVSAHKAASIAEDAAKYALAAGRTITKLDESSKEIEQVVKIISDIAAQTRLLALNATIESARAGTAGKGFAVVANEVKTLADQTTEATDSIRERIEKIQNETQETVTVIHDISNVIENVSKLSVTIASAVEEQSVATSDILGSVNDAANGVSEITLNITGVAQAAESTSSGATDSKSSSRELARMASALQTMVEQFKY